MKKILVHNCSDCPFADFNIHGNAGSRRILFKCDHDEVENSEWVEGYDVPEYCPLEDVDDKWRMVRVNRMKRETLQELIENKYISNADKLKLLQIEHKNVSFKSGYYLGTLKYVEEQIQKLSSQGEDK